MYASLRPPPKIALKHDSIKELGSEVARQPEGEVARQAEGSQPIQPNPNPIMIERGDPLFAHKKRGDPLCAHNQSVHLQRSTRWTSTSEYLSESLDILHSSYL